MYAQRGTALLLLVAASMMQVHVGRAEDPQPVVPEQDPEKEPTLTEPEPAMVLAPLCDNSCSLPHCYCNSTDIPGGLSRADTPQMVLFTFNDPITEAVKPYMSRARDIMPTIVHYSGRFQVSDLAGFGYGLGYWVLFTIIATLAQR